MFSRPLAIKPQIVVRDVTVLRGKTSVEVRIEASGLVAPVAKVLSDPERIVIDLPDVGYPTSRRLPVDAGDVQGVRVALFHVDPPITRVVVDLAHPHNYRLLTARSSVILIIDTNTAPAAANLTAAATASSTPSAATPADQPAASTRTPEVKEQKPIAPAQPSTVADAPTVIQPAPVSQAKLEPPSAAPPEAPPQPSAAAPPLEPRVSLEQPNVALVGIPTGSIQVSPADDEETTPHQAAKGKRPGLVRNVTVSNDNNAVEVRIEGNKPMQASASTLSNPQRIIIDLANVRWEHPHHIPVKLSEVQAVDVSLYLVNPLVTRVVVSMAHAHPYHLQQDGDSLVVRIETEEISADGSQPAH